MACGLALLASGQAFAVTYFSNANTIADNDLSSPTNWFDNNCPAFGGNNVPVSISLGAGDRITICSGHSLSLSTGVTLGAGSVVFDGGTWTGTMIGKGIKFSAGNKVIVNTGGALTIPLLDISLMAAGNTIFINMGPVIFTSVTGKSLECPSGTAYNGGTTQIAPGTTCTVAAAAVNNSVSAPIFSTKEKPAVFSEEVK